jgi:hypothetical protein
MPRFVDVVGGSIAVPYHFWVGVEQNRRLQLSAVHVLVAVQDVQACGDAACCQSTRAEVPIIAVHTTRKTCASLLVALDVHPRVAMQILRHSQIAVTMNVYSEASSEDTREALRRLSESLSESDHPA